MKGRAVVSIAFIAVLATTLPAVSGAESGGAPSIHPVRLATPDGRPFPEGSRVVSWSYGPRDGAAIAQPPAATRELAFDVVAQIYPSAHPAIAFGDADHDSRTEAVIYVNDTYTYHYRILEEQGGNVYTDEYSGDELIPYGIGDFDGDGLTDLVGQVGDRLKVYESVDASSYPTRLAWTSPPLINVEGFVKVADSDRDGHQEFIYSYNPFSGMAKLYIFENTGPDSYTQVYVTNIGQDDNTGEKVVADLDNDGRTEIAMCGLLGNVYVYEATGNNQWRRVYTSYTGLFNAYGCEGGVDTNGNGLPEFFVTGSSDPRWCWESQVFEAPADNLFGMVAYLDTTDGTLGLGANAMGDLDGIPPQEFMSIGTGHFWIWVPNTTGGWDLSQTVDDPLGAGHFHLQCYDANRNGRAELFWVAEDEMHRPARTLVMEAQSSASADGMPAGAARPLMVAPNPCIDLTRISLPPGSGPTRLRVFDPAGRLLSVESLDPASPIWRPAAAGVYWIRVDSARRPLGSARVVVTR